VRSDPEVASLIERLEAEGRPSSIDLPLTEGRRNFDEFVAALSERDPALTADDVEIDGGSGDLRLRIYRDESAEPGPAIVFFHGGGWVFGGLDSHDGLCRALARESGALVVAVDYRLAPEHPFPAALEDCVGATAWVAAHGAEIGAGRRALAVAGDSAGANLAACVALHARDRGGPELALQLLFYPPTSHDGGGGDSEQNGFFLSRADMDWYWARYAGTPGACLDPYAAPALAATFAGLPPAYVVAAGDDPLREETVAYAERLAEAGVPVRLRVYDEMVHGFMLFTRFLSVGREAIEEAGSAAREALGVVRA
jgi:acetyl esterase/lipase